VRGRRQTIFSGPFFPGRFFRPIRIEPPGRRYSSSIVPGGFDVQS